MIEFIRGIVAYRTAETIVVETGGVGYLLFCVHPLEWEEGEEVTVYTHQVIREDAHTLYGFRERQVRDLFRLLLEVSGIGPKVALAVTGAGNPGRLVEAVEQEDLRFLTKLPGVGKKTAQRIVLDLKDKLKKSGLNESFVSAVRVDTSRQVARAGSLEAIEALQALGYNEEEASQAVAIARKDFGEEEPGLDQWIRRALQFSMKE
ncbi:Holliday junction DNA helicase RuvA [Kroppenstedtia sanguinis]|uniref:Holliday junction branch migration complex subunit RuvA n=1 Tax=Kroppenstedtia sanguinis TaxID=1380684 RepID=A0ABW4C709_9BACL